MKKSRKTKKSRRRQRKTHKMQKGGSIFAVLVVLVLLSKLHSVLEPKPAATPAAPLPNTDLPLIVAVKAAGPDASIYDEVQKYRDDKSTTPEDKAFLGEVQSCYQDSVSSAQGHGLQNAEETTYNRCFAALASSYVRNEEAKKALKIKHCFESGSDDRCLDGNEKVFKLKLSVIDDKRLIENKPNMNVDKNLDFTFNYGNIQVKGDMYHFYIGEKDGLEPLNFEIYEKRINDLIRKLMSSGNLNTLLEQIEGGLYFIPESNTAVIVNENQVIKLEMPQNIFQETQHRIER